MKHLVLSKSKKAKFETTWIGAHPSLGNAVAKALLENGHITEAIFGNSNQTITKIQSEVGQSSIY